MGGSSGLLLLLLCVPGSAAEVREEELGDSINRLQEEIQNMFVSHYDLQIQINTHLEQIIMSEPNDDK